MKEDIYDELSRFLVIAYRLAEEPDPGWTNIFMSWEWPIYRHYFSNNLSDLLRLDPSRQLVHLHYFLEERLARYRSNSLAASIFAFEVQSKITAIVHLGGLDNALLTKLMKKNKEEFEADQEKSNSWPTEPWNPFA